MNGKIIWIETSSRAIYLPTRKFYEKKGYAVQAELTDFYAPGDNIVSTWINDQYVLASGTSLAVPFVSGILSFYLANGGSASNAYHYLLSHGDNIGHNLRLVQYAGSSHHYFFGYHG